MLQIASIGECMVELAASSPTTYQRGYAGDTFNAAVYCARALTTFNNPSIVIEYVTALGDQDAFSQGIETLCHAEHLGTTLIRHLPGRLPGLYLIETDPTGERHFHFYRSEAPARDLFAGPEGLLLCEALLEKDVWYFSGILLAILKPESRTRFLDYLKRAYDKGIQLYFDLNYRARLWDQGEARAVVSPIFPYLTGILPSFEEEQALFGDATPAETLERYRTQGIHDIVVKDGAKGYWLWEQAAQHYPVQPAPRVIDTTAAGDSFNGTYLAYRLTGHSPTVAATNAACIAKHVVQYRGAITPLFNPLLQETP
ncbi:MAG: hypothetical protein A3J38_05525 [Gammaproteobacteria bacterium RIFCSPHIGHO2_12_FULL_45_9]|nr:MAG: hypothetical protein A3J38_05525 [Gammaproteobacteria bacterium RIFCSPHIGHO2_12_FULL_45_9]